MTLDTRLRVFPVYRWPGRLRGLLGRKPLRRGLGLWLVPCQAVHTFGMYYSLDIIFLDHTGQARKIIPRLRPGRVAFCLAAMSVVEFEAGVVDIENGGVDRVEAAVKNAASGNIDRYLQDINQRWR